MTRRNRDLFAALEELQGGACGICGSTSDPEIDHDHDNGFIRGILCRTCNRTEGRHGTCDWPEECPTCTWRLRPAVAWLGWTERYQGPTDPGSWYVMSTPWKPTVHKVEDHRADRRRMADAVYRMFPDEATA